MTSKKLTLVPYLFFFFSFSVYLFTATPNIYWRDAPEFQAIGFLLDIAHPSGSPLYAIVAKLFTTLPLGSIGFKVTLLSSFFGASLSVLLYFLLKTIIIDFLSKKNAEPSMEIVALISLVTAILFSFSNALWKNSNIPEVYSLQVFFLGVLLFILLKVSSPHPSKKIRANSIQILCAFSFLYGLSLGAHSVLVLYFPFFLLYIYFKCLRFPILPKIKTSALLAFFFLIGFSVYLYLPIRSTQNPYYDWGDPETFFRLMSHVSDRKDAAYHFMFSFEKLLSQLKLYLQLFINNFSILGLFLGITGLVYLLRKKEKSLLSLLALLYFPPFLFFIRYWWEESAFLVNFLIFSILIGLGLWLLQNELQRRLKEHPRKTYYSVIIWTLLGLQLLSLLNTQYQKNNKADYWEPRSILMAILSDIPPNAVVFSSRSAFGFNYFQQAEGYRPDISFFNVLSFIFPDLYMTVAQSKFPNVILPDVEASRLGPIFIKQNVTRKPIFWEPDRDKNKFVEKYLRPDAFLFKVSEKPTQLDSNTINSYLHALSKQVQFDRDLKDIEERRFYSLLIGGQGSFFFKRGAMEIAKEHFEIALNLMPDDSRFLNLLGLTYVSLNQYEQAERVFLNGIEVNPINAELYLNLAKLYDDKGMGGKAEYFFEKVLEFIPEQLEVLMALGKLNTEKGEKDLANSYLQKALTLSFENEALKSEIETLLKLTY